MLKVVLTNNGGATEKIVDEAQSVSRILEDAGFTYANANLTINGRTINPEYINEPLEKFVDAGTSVVRITAVAHKSNA